MGNAGSGAVSTVNHTNMNDLTTQMFMQQRGAHIANLFGGAAENKG